MNSGPAVGSGEATAGLLYPSGYGGHPLFLSSPSMPGVRGAGLVSTCRCQGAAMLSTKGSTSGSVCVPLLRLLSEAHPRGGPCSWCPIPVGAVLWAKAVSQLCP